MGQSVPLLQLKHLFAKSLQLFEEHYPLEENIKPLAIKLELKGAATEPKSFPNNWNESSRYLSVWSTY